VLVGVNLDLHQYGSKLQKNSKLNLVCVLADCYFVDNHREM
jgi:hypothetical protein